MKLLNELKDCNPILYCFGWLYLIVHPDLLLDNKRRVRNDTWAVVVVMIIEQLIITWQVANGRLSHFNTMTVFYRWLFIFMGVAISVLTAWTGVIGYYFFRQRRFTIPMP